MSQIKILPAQKAGKHTRGKRGQQLPFGASPKSEVSNEMGKQERVRFPDGAHATNNPEKKIDC